VANEHRQALLKDLEDRFGELRRLPASNSLIVLGQDAARVYLRYSRVHERRTSFFGLRRVDLAQLEGHNSFICFFTDDPSPPLFVPYADFEDVIRKSPLAADGQYKVQISFRDNIRELYIARVGRFNLDGYAGFEELGHRIHLPADIVPSLNHCQVQTLLGAIGNAKGFGVYVPLNNVPTMDWSLTKRFHLVERLPPNVESKCAFSTEVDVIWIDHNGEGICALFEVEYSTPVYSGLLRFNDVLLTSTMAPRFFIVSNEGRRDVFSRQIQRPTFQRSGLSEITSFLDYPNVYSWYRRLCKSPRD
jgi:hypothetical protein